MKESEKLALAYLTSRGHAEIDYEPDGNVPPDFLINGKIAVEVRRLNQNQLSAQGKAHGLETEEFALLRCVRAALRSIPHLKSKSSWFVLYTFSRPIPPLVGLKQRIVRTLSSFGGNEGEPREYRLFSNFIIEVSPASDLHPDRYLLGGYSDLDQGGWLIPELERNINICIAEKTRKINRVRAKYSEWWLVLIDNIGFGRKEAIRIVHQWDKVIIVNPLDPTLAYEL
jgi:hypothetical protein